MEGVITVFVKPNARKSEIISSEGSTYRVAVAAPAEKGKANVELVKFLSKHTGKDVRIISGLTSKKKIVKLD